MSQALRCLLDHWKTVISEAEILNLPFNLEEFCRDQDKAYADLAAVNLSLLKEVRRLRNLDGDKSGDICGLPTPITTNETFVVLEAIRLMKDRGLSSETIRKALEFWTGEG